MKFIKTMKIEFTQEDKELFEKLHNMTSEICNTFHELVEEKPCESCPFFGVCSDLTVADIVGGAWDAIDEYEDSIDYIED